MKKIRIALIGSIAFFAMTTGGVAEDVISIAVDNSNPPFMYGQGNSASGLYPDILREAFKKANLAVAVKPYPWKRALALGESGEAGIGGIYKNGEREKIYDYSAPLYTEKITIFVKKGKKFAYNSPTDLKGKKIGVLAGWSYGEAFDKARKDGLFKVEETESDATNFKKLGIDRLDCVLALDISGKLAMVETGTQSQVEALENEVEAKDTYLVFAKLTNRKVVLEKFNTAIQEMRKDGSLAQIIASHQGK